MDLDILRTAARLRPTAPGTCWLCAGRARFDWHPALEPMGKCATCWMMLCNP